MTANTLVVKIGGSAGVDAERILPDLIDIAAHRPLIVVHGVSERMAQLSAERDMPVQMLHSPSGHSSRYTPPAVRDLFVEAATQINTELVNALRAYGIDAHGAVDPLVIRGQRKTAIRAVMNGRVRVVRDDHTGHITTVDVSHLHQGLNAGRVIVVPPMAASPDGPLNIDGDRAAVAVAGAVDAAEVVILSNVRGLYRDYRQPTSFVETVTAAQMDTAMTWAEGRMKRKVLSARDALEQGINRVIIGDGRTTQPIRQALQGEGTVFIR